jgi:DNA-directed RNA polymerase subunit L
MSKVIFSLSENKNGDIKVEIEGTGKELINLLASAIDESDDVKEVVELALLAVNLKSEAEADSEDFLNEMFSKIKATAQA